MNDRPAPHPARPLRVALALVAAIAPLVPHRRRAAWRQQWTADLWYQWAFLVDQDGAGPRASFELARRASGALPHAVLLRARSWRVPVLITDVRYGIRMLAKRPGFALVAILLLGLGVGANATIFSWIEGVVLRPLPAVSNPGRLAVLHGTMPTRRNLSLSYPNFVDLRNARPDGVAAMAAHRAVAVDVRVGGEPERAWCELVTGDFFSVLGVRARLGRVLVPDDDGSPGTGAVVVLSDEYWRRRFAADPDVVGRTIGLNGKPFTIVGVAAKGFHGGSVAMALDLWVPMSMQRSVTPGDRLTNRGTGWLHALLRLAPGGTVRQAQAGLSVVMARLVNEYPDDNPPDYGVAVYPLWRDPASASAILAPVLTVLMAVVAVVLLIACANLANLLLARGVGRQREIAVRLALGASRGRIVVQLLAESVALALAGGGAGLAVAAWTSRLLAAFVPPTPLPIAPDTHLSPTVFLFGVALALVTTVLFGLVPALQTSRPDLVPSLKETLGAIGGRRRAWVRRALVVTQVSLSLVLLVGAGLFIRTMQNASRVDAGFDMPHGLLASIDLLPGGYDRARGTELFKTLLERVRAVPGVEDASLAQDLPLNIGGGSDTSGEIEGYEPGKGERITIYYTRVAPRYFRTLGIPIVNGRALTDADTSEDAPVIVVNETMARRYWKGRDPIGGRVRIGRWVTVVGVAADVKYSSPSAPPVAYMYLPVYTFYRPDTTLVVRTAGAPAAVAAPIRAAVKTVDPNLPLFDVTTMAEHRDLATFIPRLAASLLGAFGLIAVLLASVGLYGLLAFTVSQRTPEIGVRLALGAQRGDVLRLVVGEGLRLTAVGVGLGLAAAFAAMPLLASQLVGVSARDGLSYAVTALVLAAAAAVASYLPARRAARVDPLKALRYE